VALASGRAEDRFALSLLLADFASQTGGIMLSTTMCEPLTKRERLSGWCCKPLPSLGQLTIIALAAVDLSLHFL
jgi:hypothetical protein